MIQKLTSRSNQEDLETTSHHGSHAGADFFLNKISEFAIPRSGMRVLIAGCGAGHEAAWIHQNISGSVDAVDVDDFVPDELKNHEGLTFRIASVCDLPFDEESFDLVFYHHVIEHVDQPQESLIELHRVLKPGGVLFVGTPNRHRLISSIGAHKQSEWDSTISNKVKDNIRDWGDRLTGRFKNNLGAHAGFSRRELDRMLAPYFGNRHWVTEEYLQFKYQEHRLRSFLPLATGTLTSWFVAPSIYAFCQKEGSAQTKLDIGVTKA